MNPVDIGDNGDPLPGPEVLEADLQILPHRAGSHAPEAWPHNQKANLAGLRRPLNGWQHHISIVFGLDLSGNLEPDHARRHVTKRPNHEHSLISGPVWRIRSVAQLRPSRIRFASG